MYDPWRLYDCKTILWKKKKLKFIILQNCRWKNTAAFYKIRKQIWKLLHFCIGILLAKWAILSELNRFQIFIQKFYFIIWCSVAINKYGNILLLLAAAALRYPYLVICQCDLGQVVIFLSIRPKTLSSDLTKKHPTLTPKSDFMCQSQEILLLKFQRGFLGPCIIHWFSYSI